jgi:ribosomal-protein-alanine N-acetyltransferase
VKTKAAVNVRWLIRKDMREVLDIENHSFPKAVWTEDDFLSALRQRNCIGMVADVCGEVVGYMIYELHNEQLRLLNFAVNQSFRRQGIGAQMIHRLKQKLSQQRRKRIVFEVRETNMDALRFFRTMGFKAYALLPGFYSDTTEDAISMRFTLHTEDELYSAFVPSNRIVL